MRESLATLCGELDAKALDDIGVLIGALSRTQSSQPEAKEGFELRLWESIDVGGDLRYELRDPPVATGLPPA